MFVLGISAFYHDSAACLLKDGEIVGAAQEERFSRIKHDAAFPAHAIAYCLKEAGIEPECLDSIVFYEKPFIKFERLLETYLAFAPVGLTSFTKAMPAWVKDKLFQKQTLIKHLKKSLGQKVNWQDRLLFSEHHLSHAASAFYPSPFKRAAVLTLDGVGEWTTTSVAVGNTNDLEIIKELHFPHSLGLLYSAFTYYTGFKVNSGEYKVMGLAPYGEPKYAELIKQNLINISEDGSFQLDMSYFDYATGLKMTSKKFDALFGGPPRSPEAELTQKDMDLAASIQQVTQDIVIKIAQDIALTTGEKNLCMAGGVALNCVANGAIKKLNLFENIWIQPAAGDAGGALGAAFAAWHLHHKGVRTTSIDRDAMKGGYLGPELTDSEIAEELDNCGAVYEKLSDEELIEQVASSLVDEKAIGWVQGRMEFGPRALGGRSIIADPRSPRMQRQLNLKVKYRESFRPFAPSILREDLDAWFELSSDSPYMLFVASVRGDKRLAVAAEQQALFGIDKLNVPRSMVPAVTHVDYSARIQTVHADTNQKYHRVIERFKAKTGCPLVVNTSFNVRGEPIICSTLDAFKCFMGTDLDVLAVGNYLLRKEKQDTSLTEAYETRYAAD